MSFIAQSRLTLLSQKCLPSMTALRCDVRDGFGYYSTSNYHYRHTISNIAKRDQISAGLLQKPIGCQCFNYNNCKQSEYNTPKLCGKGRKKATILDRMLDNELMKRVDTAKLANVIKENNLPYATSSRETFFSNILSGDHIIRLTNDRENTTSSHLYKKIRYLLENANRNRNLCAYLSLFNPFMSSRSSRSKTFLELSPNFQSDNNNSGEENFREHDTKFLVSMVGVLGVFRGMSASDIEEEKAKLSDEQKMKKMKPAELLIAKGVLSMCDQDYNKASELFHKALHIAQDEKNEEQETLVLNLLASNFFESGDLENAEKLFIDLMKRMIAHDVEPTSPAILELSLKLASIYSSHQNTHEKALKGYKFVINSLLSNLQDIANNVAEIEIHEISEDKKDELALLGWSYDWFAKHLIVINDFNTAVDMLQRALEISSKILGPLHDQTLILLNDVGTTLAMSNAPERGKTFIKKAVEGAIESKSAELASFYVNLGLVNLKLNKLSEAKRYCEYSMELASKNCERHNSQDVIKLSRTCLDEVERLLEFEKQ